MIQVIIALVVLNIYPSGEGMLSYTFLGGVLQLPVGA